MRLPAINILSAGVALAGALVASTAQATVEATFSYGSYSSGTITGTSYSGGTEINMPGPFTVGEFSISNVVVTSNSGVSPYATPDISGGWKVKNTAASALTLDVEISDIGFTPPSTNQPQTLSDSGSATFSGLGEGTGNSFSVASYADPNNGYFTDVNPTPTYSFTNTSYPQSVNGPSEVTTFSLGSSTDFSISTNLAITLNAGNTILPSYQVTETPEPASLAMLSMGIAGLLLKRRKKV